MKSATLLSVPPPHRTIGVTVALMSLVVGLQAQLPTGIRRIPVLPKEPMVASVAPPPGELKATGTPATATVSWQSVPGATGYQIFRSSAANPAWIPLTPTPITAVQFEDLSGGFDSRVVLTYRVIALLAKGQSAPADIPFQPPPPNNPAWARATPSGNTVVLTWAAVPGASRYAVAGQSEGDWRDLPASNTSVTYYNVPQGAHEWRVAAIYDPGAVETPAAQWTAASVNTAVTSGRYRISIAGFRVNSESYDDILERDGKRDEVYAATIVAEVDRQTGKVRRTDVVKSEVHGDANGFPSREPAGHASSVGGLMAGDVVPTGWDPAQPSPAPRSLGRFPLTIWEGTLGDGADAVVVRPTLWEWDGDAAILYYWRDYWLARTGELWNLARSDAGTSNLGTIAGGRSPVFAYTGNFYPSNEEQARMWPGRDRLIGLDALGGDYMSRAYRNEKLLVVTREKIEAALAHPAALQLGPGVVALSLVDTRPPDDHYMYFNADYVLYLRVERLP
jgi:hypothetical protein